MCESNWRLVRFGSLQGRKTVIRDDQAGSTLPRRQLGRALREAREGAGFTLEHVAREMEISKTSIIRVEKGHNEKVKLHDVERYGDLYDLDEDRIAELKALAQQTATKSWWQPARHLLLPGYHTYLGLEPVASRLSFFQSMIVPGLLQTADYAKVIERSYIRDDKPDDADRRVDIRLRRSVVLTRRRKPIEAEFILHESLLHICIGSRAIMAKQLRKMADMSTLENVTVRIIPFSIGFPGELIPVLPYIILDFPEERRGFGTEPSVVYTESNLGSMFLEDIADVELHREIHTKLRDAAWKEQESRDRLRKLARRYEQ